MTPHKSAGLSWSPEHGQRVPSFFPSLFLFTSSFKTTCKGCQYQGNPRQVGLVKKREVQGGTIGAPAAAPGSVLALPLWLIGEPAASAPAGGTPEGFQKPSWCSMGLLALPPAHQADTASRMVTPLMEMMFHTDVLPLPDME